MGDAVLVSLSEQMEQWQSEVTPTLENLVATLDLAERSVGNGPVMLGSVSDQLGAAARDAREWMSTHQCPVADSDDRLTRMIRSYGILARLLQTEALNTSGPNLLAIEREMKGLIGMFAQTMAMLSDRTGS